MPTKRIVPPLGGAANNSAYASQPAHFAPASTIRNVRAYDTAKDRPRMGTGPGIRKLSPTRIGGGRPLQALATVTRPAGVAGYQVGPVHPITSGVSTLASAIAGNVFEFGPGTYPEINWDATIDVTGDGGPGTIGAVAASRHRETDLLVVATEPYDDGGGFDVANVVAFNELGMQVWSRKLFTALADRSIRSLAVGRLYTYACSNQYVVAIRNDTGTIAATTDIDGWSGEAVQAVVADDGDGFESVYVAFNGVRSAGTLPNAPNYTVTAGAVYAAGFRAGVTRLRVPTESYSTTPVFTRIRLGRQRAITDPFYEADHGYARISEMSRFAPRGALINGLARDSDGSLMVTRCNAGPGPNNTWKPDLTVVDPVTVMKLSAEGVLIWEVDTDSWVEAGVESVLNDIPTAPGELPSVTPIAVNGASHEITVGGRANANGVSLFKLRGSDGGMLAQANYMTPATDTVGVQAIRIDATDGQAVLVGDRNSDYDGAGADFAQMWKANIATLAPVWAVDLGAIDALGLTLFNDGRIVAATDQL